MQIVGSADSALHLSAHEAANLPPPGQRSTNHVAPRAEIDQSRRPPDPHRANCGNRPIASHGRPPSTNRVARTVVVNQSRRPTCTAFLRLMLNEAAIAASTSALLDCAVPISTVGWASTPSGLTATVRLAGLGGAWGGSGSLRGPEMGVRQIGHVALKWISHGLMHALRSMI
eukprot:7526128-Pyramimonas_sp.AAC.2